MKQITKLVGMMTACVFALGQGGDAWGADANPPERMTYQGFLVDGNGAALGNSVPANYDVVFRIYNVKSGGEPIWSEQQTVTVDKGYFSVLLGEGTGFGNEPRSEKLSTAFVGADISDRFIGITVGGLGGVDVEIAPRLRLVASPFAFTASQARNVSDGSGNRNLFREVDSSNNASLKLGAGSTPTLTLQEAGDATLAGKLTIDLPAAGVGLEIKEQGTSTKFGGLVGNRFSMSTARGGFHFDKSIYVDGDIYSFNRDARLYPSDNADNFLNVNHDGDTIDAYTDKFYVRDHGVSYLEIDPTSSALNLSTDAAGFYMNRTLETAGNLTAKGNHVNLYGNSPTMQYYDSDGEDYWIHVNGDRMYFIHGTEDGWHSDRPLTIHKNKIGINKDSPSHALDVSGDIAASGSFLVTSSRGLRNVQGSNYGSVETVGGGGNGWEGYNIAGRYAFMSHTNQDVGIYYDTSNAWLTLYQPNGFANGRGMYRIFLASNDQQEKLRLTNGNGSLYASYDGDSNWDFYSDRRLKENIIKEDKLLDRIMNLDVVNFDFIGEEKKKHKEIGFIAQDIERHFPSLVSEAKDDRYDFDVKALGYSSFGVIAVGGVKELKNEKDAEVASLEKKNKQLESRVQSLESEMSLLKAQLANSTTQEDRIAKLEELVGKIGRGQ